jgi:5'-methylthioadenosine phosphorylase
MVDQLVDRTAGREGTFFDGPEVFHVPFADPYDAGLAATFAAVARRQGRTVHEGGTVVVIPGPRFSTRAEADWHRSQGWDVVNMTQAPEAALAAEAGLRYVGVALVTDHDAGHETDASIAPVTEADVFRFLADNAQAMRELLAAAVGELDL